MAMNRLALILLFIAISLPAAAANIYEIKNVSVSVAEKDAAKARSKAMLDADAKAFGELQKKLVASGLINSAKTISAAQIEAAVDSVDIVSEKIGTKEYKATYNVTFSAPEVSRIFTIKEIAATVDPQKFLVVPIVVENGAVKIWKNNWIQNWQAENHADITIPLGDLQDVQSLKNEDLAAKKYDGVFRMQKRYGSTVIALVRGEFIADKNVLNVELQKIKDLERTTVTYEYPGGNNITADDLFEAAASDIIYRLENNKLTENSVDVEAPPVPKVKVPEPYSPYAPGAGYIGETKYPPVTAAPAAKPLAQLEPATADITIIAADLIAWNRIRNSLVNTQGVSGLKIKSFVDGKANISINATDMSKLVMPLADKGLDLSQQGPNWLIKEKQ